MGLPSGLLWSPVNIDVSQPGGFAESAFKYDYSYFSWGNIVAHNPTSESSFAPYTWGGVNSNEPYYEGQVYGQTPGVELSNDIPLDNDVANVILGGQWRMPSAADFAELLDNVDFIDADGNIIDQEVTDKRITINNCVGIYVRSRINGNKLFFPAGGYGSSTALLGRSVGGFYWTKSYYNSKAAIALKFDAELINANFYSSRFLGLGVRPVLQLT